MCPQPLELRGPYDIINLYPSAPGAGRCVCAHARVLLICSSAVCCSVCRTETLKKPFPPPVDPYCYTQVRHLLAPQKLHLNRSAAATINVMSSMSSETRKTASGIIYTMKSCGDVSSQQEAPPAAGDGRLGEWVVMVGGLPHQPISSLPDRPHSQKS